MTLLIRFAEITVKRAAKFAPSHTIFFTETRKEIISNQDIYLRNITVIVEHICLVLTEN
jgi:hypothetical protein